MFYIILFFICYKVLFINVYCLNYSFFCSYQHVNVACMMCESSVLNLDIRNMLFALYIVYIKFYLLFIFERKFELNKKSVIDECILKSLAKIMSIMPLKIVLFAKE